MPPCCRWVVSAPVPAILTPRCFSAPDAPQSMTTMPSTTSPTLYTSDRNRTSKRTINPQSPLSDHVTTVNSEELKKPTVVQLLPPLLTSSRRPPLDQAPLF
mmetsp:Transcript_54293/g.172395  ORF Transcript_54293/g.172395 Transcript_54293/m.172395 type:complete len:101 (-) Transcript_54293:971-1273(-)